MPVVKHLIADTFGSHIGKYSERLKITQKHETLAQAPLLHLESVSVLNHGISISADALEACCERGIPVFFLDPQGAPYASVYAAGLVGTVLTRREQLRAYDDERGLFLGKAFAAGKIRNQSATLRYLAKTRLDTPQGNSLLESATAILDDVVRLDQIAGNSVETARGHILAVEGNAARLYWDAVRLVLPVEYGWSGREGRGATDPINSLLNYGYGILYGQIERALTLAGLDPYAGYIHTDRPGKPSLVLDFIEVFRQVAVDRVVFGLANRHFNIEQDEHHRLGEAVRQTFAAHILEHLETAVRYEGQRHALRQVIQMQARQIASYLRGDIEVYLPFKAES